MMKIRPLLLDLFCGAGGAAMGYHRAGFDIVGIDHKPQPNYPFPFAQLEWDDVDLDGFDVIHASPPCQRYSLLTAVSGKPNEKPDLVADVRAHLRGRVYVIENVMSAPLVASITLFGSPFGLGVWRHRQFESSLGLSSRSCAHDQCPYPLDVTGTGGPVVGERKKKTGGKSRKPSSVAQAGQAMGITWMTRRELTQAIPPAYTEYLGRQIIQQL